MIHLRKGSFPMSSNWLKILAWTHFVLAGTILTAFMNIFGRFLWYCLPDPHVKSNPCYVEPSIEMGSILLVFTLLDTLIPFILLLGVYKRASIRWTEIFFGLTLLDTIGTMMLTVLSILGVTLIVNYSVDLIKIDGFIFSVGLPIKVILLIVCLTYRSQLKRQHEIMKVDYNVNDSDYSSKTFDTNNSIFSTSP